MGLPLDSFLVITQLSQCGWTTEFKVMSPAAKPRGT